MAENIPDDRYTVLCTGSYATSRALARHMGLRNWHHAITPEHLKGLSAKVRVVVDWPTLRSTTNALHWRETLDRFPTYEEAPW